MLLLLWLAGCSDLFREEVLGEPLVDRNCDPRIPFWQDADGDGLGGDTDLYLGCEAPEGYATDSGDCDDADATVTAGCADSAGDP